MESSFSLPVASQIAEAIVTAHLITSSYPYKRLVDSRIFDDGEKLANEIDRREKTVSWIIRPVNN